MFFSKPMVDHVVLLRAATERFFAVNQRWPKSMDELDPYGIRGFITDSVTGFGQATEAELCLRYTCPLGKFVVRINRPTQESG